MPIFFWDGLARKTKPNPKYAQYAHGKKVRYQGIKNAKHGAKNSRGKTSL